jgi:hypothetical protein
VPSFFALRATQDKSARHLKVSWMNGAALFPMTNGASEASQMTNNRAAGPATLRLEHNRDVDIVALEFLAAVEEGQLNQELDLYQLAASLLNEARGRCGRPAGG